MTNPQPLIIEAADARRAAAFVCHYGSGNTDGMHAILKEAAESKRGIELLLAVVQMYDEIVPVIHSEFGLQILSRQVMKLAGLEGDTDATT